MFDEDAARTLHAAQEAGGYVYPDYEGASFADVPEAGLSVVSERFTDDLPAGALAGYREDVDNVVLFVVDGLGWDQYRRDRAEASLLDRLAEHGRVTPLTTIYPSETAAAITTSHTGLTPVEHGLLGWHAYLQEVGESVFTLPFETRNGRPVGELDPDAGAELLFEGDPLYGRAGEAGVDCHAIQPASVEVGAYSDATTAGATTHGYGSLAELGVTLREVVTAAEAPSYTYAYAPHVDSVAHAVGTDAARYRATVSTLCHAVERELARVDDRTAERTLLLLTADHGHLDTGPDTRVLLDAVGGVTDLLARDAAGDPIPPQGGPRNLQFHVREGRVPELRDRLETGLACVTFDREEYLAADLFGPADPTPAFERRAPDLVAVHRDSAVWDHEGALDHVGVHGGLSRAEMLVPLAAARLSELTG